jgi:hypothetical protein
VICLTVKTVVDSVNYVVSRRRSGSETALVLLDQILFCSSKSGDTVHFRYSLVWSITGDLSSDGGVKTGHLQVHTDIGVVDIDNVGSTQVADSLVVTYGVGGGGKGRKSRNNGCLRKELTTLSSKLSGRSLGVVTRLEGRNGAARTTLK